MSRNEVGNRIVPARNAARDVANSSATAVKRSMIRTRAWAAPQVDHAGHFFQNTAAPKISALLFATARRLAPNRARWPRWRKLAAGASALGAGAAASAVAVTARGRRKQDKPAPEDED